MPELRLQAEGSARVKEPEGLGRSRSGERGGQTEETELGGGKEGPLGGREGPASRGMAAHSPTEVRRACT